MNWSGILTTLTCCSPVDIAGIKNIIFRYEQIIQKCKLHHNVGPKGEQGNQGIKGGPGQQG